MVKQTSRNISFDEVWNNGYGVRIPDIPYIFERISSDMTASVQCIENFDEIVKRIENGGILTRNAGTESGRLKSRMPTAST